MLTITGTATANSNVEIFDGSTQLGKANVNGSGAWTYTTPTLSDGAQSFTAKDVNAAGNISAASAALSLTIVTAATVTQVGSNFDISTVTVDPVLKYGGANVTAGEFPGWTPIAAVQTATGYDVAWKDSSTSQYGVWTIDNNGNYTGYLIGGAVSGNSYAFESLEPLFQQDLNGDGVIGVPKKIIQTDGSTVLTEMANEFYLNSSGGSGPALKYQGADVTAGEFGGWTPLGAVQTASGYDVAWKNTSTNQYTVWSVDSNGNYTGNPTGGAVSGNSNALETLEPVFQQDLNGDGIIGIPTTISEVANKFNLDESTGSDPLLKYNGAGVTAGEFGSWTPIGAAQTAAGFDVAWKNTGTGQYTIWTTDSSGNYTGNLVGGAVAGNSFAFESAEPVFGKDLNGDGVVGLYATPRSTLQISNTLTGPSGSATIGTGATLELAAADSASLTFSSSTGTLVLDHSSTFTGRYFQFHGKRQALWLRSDRSQRRKIQLR